MFIISVCLILVLLLHRNNLALKWSLKANDDCLKEAIAFINNIPVGMDYVKFRKLLDRSKEFRQILEKEFPNQILLVFMLSEWSYEQIASKYNEKKTRLKHELQLMLEENNASL